MPEERNRLVAGRVPQVEGRNPRQRPRQFAAALVPDAVKPVLEVRLSKDTCARMHSTTANDRVPAAKSLSRHNACALLYCRLYHQRERKCCIVFLFCWFFTQLYILIQKKARGTYPRRHEYPRSLKHNKEGILR